MPIKEIQTWHIVDDITAFENMLQKLKEVFENEQQAMLVKIEIFEKENENA